MPRTRCSESALPVALALGVVLAAACDDVQLRAAVSLEPEPVVSDLIEEEFSQAYCAYAVRCRTMPLADARDCLDYLKLWAPGRSTFDSLRAIEDSVLAGRIRFDGLAARRCLDRSEVLDCAASPQALDVVFGCGAAFEGRVEPGGRCTTDLACTEGSFCSAPEDSPCNGRCVRAGATCRTDADCAGREACDEGRCAAPDVAPGRLGERCGTNNRCAPGLACVGSSASNDARCLPPPTQDQPCDVAGACAEGFVCDYDKDRAIAAMPMCIRWGAPTAGSRCTMDPGSCGGELVCVVTPGTYEGTCREPKTLDDDCSQLYECGGVYSPFVCDLAEGTCVARRSEGACAGGDLFGCDLRTSYCDLAAPGGPTCRPFKATGEPCGAGHECGPVFQ